jgi:Fur family peroxide stress response transcriptional regulator
MSVQRRKIGQRYSRQREHILKIVQNTDSHPTADWVYEQARAVIPNISLGTVYRNLNLLVEEGLIQRVLLGDGIVRYDGKLGPHHHFICTKTGKIYDVEVPIGDSLLKELAAKTGLKATSYKIEFYGEKT